MNLLALNQIMREKFLQILAVSILSPALGFLVDRLTSDRFVGRLQLELTAQVEGAFNSSQIIQMIQLISGEEQRQPIDPSLSKDGIGSSLCYRLIKRINTQQHEWRYDQSHSIQYDCGVEYDSKLHSYFLRLDISPISPNASPAGYFESQFSEAFTEVIEQRWIELESVGGVFDDYNNLRTYFSKLANKEIDPSSRYKQYFEENRAAHPELNIDFTVIPAKINQINFSFLGFYLGLFLSALILAVSSAGKKL